MEHVDIDAMRDRAEGLPSRLDERRVLAMCAEIEQLRRWKSEATKVIDAWEGVYIIAGQPGMLGESKPHAVSREIQRLRSANAAWMNGVADVVEPYGYDRQAASGPADLLPGLTDLRAHGMEMARRLQECVEARAVLYEQLERRAMTPKESDQ